MCSLIAKLSSLRLSLSIVSSSSSSSSSSSKDGKPNSKSVKLREDWRQRSRPIPPGGTYPAKDHCSRCGLCDTYYIAHFKEACAFLGDGMSKIEGLEPVVHGRGRKTGSSDEILLPFYDNFVSGYCYSILIMSFLFIPFSKGHQRKCKLPSVEHHLNLDELYVLGTNCVDNGTREGLDKFLKAASSEPETVHLKHLDGHIEEIQQLEGMIDSFGQGKFISEIAVDIPLDIKKEHQELNRTSNLEDKIAVDEHLSCY
ncbi:7-hydroxymethyl chlorophyll a reductase, chloroplastic-like [Prunus persica]|uniref:7-hydroxymethyl chlorophyll a reductase, chloroplastic-like n=1 Tax=Prunus persica TaxID=3760 RepID=UPI0009AB6EA6|nr:7-hydroxymethyl chlorophyll a reductase, chloroplastic-like [Prunus persica]